MWAWSLITTADQQCQLHLISDTYLYSQFSSCVCQIVVDVPRCVLVPACLPVFVPWIVWTSSGRPAFFHRGFIALFLSRFRSSCWISLSFNHTEDQVVHWRPCAAKSDCSRALARPDHSFTILLTFSIKTLFTCYRIRCFTDCYNGRTFEAGRDFAQFQ